MSSIPSERLLGPAPLAGWLGSGQAALFPTDTLPALAARPDHASALWTLKQRSLEKPLILMGAEMAQLQPLLGLPWHDAWFAMAETGWPGALTLVLPAVGPTVEALHPGGSSLGLRVPACAAARELLALSGPLATTSANASGQPAAITAAEAAAAFPTLPLLAPVPWPAAQGTASTVLAWRPESGGWQVLRRGAVLPPGLE
jgi:L-threonylcarbamoyladenylate synthase